MYVRFVNEKPEEYSVERLRRDNPQVSFPAVMNDAFLAEWGIERVTVIDPPKINHDTHRLVQSELYQVNGKWQCHYTPEPLPQAHVEQVMRAERNRRLTECDWTQVADAPVDRAAWAAYRQALRDISAQPDFPFEIDWPVPPSHE